MNTNAADLNTVEHRVNGVLLDIEGTTSSIAFVYDVLFPYASQHLRSFLLQHWDEAEVAHAREMIAQDIGAASFASWIGSAASDKDCALELVATEVERLMSGDIKATGLKELQGLIWRQGYLAGTLKSHVFADVPVAMKKWSEARLDIRIYSSGSVQAQKLFFAHTDHGDLSAFIKGNYDTTTGDLSAFIKGNYDTTTGAKRDRNSYEKIAFAYGKKPAAILFLSDVEVELDAAAQAGMKTCLLVRPGNHRAGAGRHTRIESFDQLQLEYLG